MTLIIGAIGLAIILTLGVVFAILVTDDVYI